MSKKNTGAQNRTESVKRVVLAESQAPESTKKLTRALLVNADGVRLKQIAMVLGMSYVRVQQIVTEHKLPYVLVSTGTRGRPPMEVTGAVAETIFTKLDPEGIRTAPKKAKPAHKTTKKAARAVETTNETPVESSVALIEAAPLLLPETTEASAQ